MSTWQEISAHKQSQRQSKIPSDFVIPANLLPAVRTSCVRPGPPVLTTRAQADVADVSTFCEQSGFFTARELEITNSTATTVVAKIASGEWSAVEVLTAVSKRAAVAQQLLNW